MATRLSYTLPIARHLLRDAATRLRRGSLASRVAPAQGQPFIIVTGTGRSGTSAVARVLHESGLPMGTQFNPPGEYNVTGYYEDVDVCDINSRILAEVGLGDATRWRRWPWRSTVLAVAGQYRAEIASLAARDVAGWKDPRFCVALEPWLSALPRRPKIVVCLRSPEAFLRSVVNIFGLVERGPIEEWWANELRRLLAVIRDYQLDAHCIEYDELVSQPQEIVDELAAFAGHPLDATYVDASLRQFRYHVPSRYAALYEEVRRLGQPAGAGRPSPVPTADEPEAIAEYVERVQALEAAAAQARAAWLQATGMPEPAIARGAPLAETRAACETYVAVLHGAQSELGAMIPPLAFETYHELIRKAIDLDRLPAQVLLHATQVDGPAPDAAALQNALTAWQRFCSPAAVAKAEAERVREYAKAAKRAGLRGPQAGS